KGSPLALSFWNLVEIYVIATVRRHHKIDMRKLRAALEYVERELGTERPLIRESFYTDGVGLFVERYEAKDESGASILMGEPVADSRKLIMNASERGQLGMREMLARSLERIELDEEGLALRVFPWRQDPNEPALVEVNSRRAFGRLSIAGTNI